MKQVKKIGIPFVSLLVVLILFFALQRLVEPKYDGRDEMPLEGNFTAEYYQETTDHDVIMVGDCEVYENIDTMALWKDYGITSYIRGNAQQLVWQSYYMLEDTLKREKPKVLIYNVQSLEHGKPERESYNRMTLDGMKWSRTKWNAIQASMCEGEHMVDYILPFLRYHSRILSLNSSDLKYYWQPKKVTHNGYYMRIDVLPASESDVADTTWLLGEQEEKTPDSPGEDGEEDLWKMMEEEDAQDLGSGGTEEETEDNDGMSAAGESDDPDGVDTKQSDDAEEIGGTDDASENGDAVDGEEDLWKMMEEEEAVSEENSAETQQKSDSVGEDSVDAQQGDDAENSENLDQQFDAYPMQYLDKMRELCEAQGIQLILMKAPSLSPVWHAWENQQMEDYAAKYKLPYINFYDLLEETDINYETDTYDGGLHLNRNGAGKLAGYLGKVLTEQYGVPDRRQEDAIAEVYQKKYQFYEEMIQAQQEELDRYGEIRSY